MWSGEGLFDGKGGKMLIDWTAVLAIGSIFTSIITFYKWVYLTYRSKWKEKRSLAIAIRKDLTKLIEEVKNYQNISMTTRTFGIQRLDVSKKYKKILEKLIEKIERYNGLLTITESFIEYGMWYISSCLKYKLEGEFEELKVGHLADELKECLKGLIIRGKDTKISWLEDTHSIFCENIKKCKHSSDFKEIPSDVKRFITANGEYIFKELEREINFIMSDASDFKEKLERDYKLT